MSCRIKLNKFKLFESNINKKFLFEDYHIVRIFDEAAHDIFNFLNTIKNNNVYIYSGWCFDNKNYKCIKSEKEICHPIYVKNIYDENDFDIYSIKDRLPEDISDNDKIFITRNAAYNNSKSGLSHEFRHVIDMYIINRNLIEKESGESELDKTDIDCALLNEVKHYYQLLMKSEQDAQIDGTIHYLEEIKETEEYKNAFKFNSFQFNIVTDLANLAEKYDRIYEFKKMERDLNIYYELEHYHILYILYLIYNERIKYTKENIIDSYKNYSKLSKNYVKKIAQRMLNIVKTNKSKYFENLYNRIATHLVIK